MLDHALAAASYATPFPALATPPAGELAQRATLGAQVRLARRARRARRAGRVGPDVVTAGLFVAPVTVAAVAAR